MAKTTITFHPKFSPINDNRRYVLIWGGRASGKSWTIAITLVLKAMEEDNIVILCVREKQNSISESVKTLLVQVIKMLGAEDNFSIKRNTIEAENGSIFHFLGLWGSTKLSSSLKGFEACKYCWVEEAQDVTKESIDMLTPTIRRAGSRIFFTMNRKRLHDPVWDFFSFLPEEDKTMINVNYFDNPYLSKEIIRDAQICKEMAPSDYMHIWLGMPEEQGANTVLKRSDIEHMYENDSVPIQGEEVIGVDVARFGSDSTQVYRRLGNAIVEHREYRKVDNVTIAREVLSMATTRYTIFIIDETGLGSGVVDTVRQYSDNVIAINFGSTAKKPEFYANRISELWFMMREIIPNVYITTAFDDQLMSELEGRKYHYTPQNKIRIEPKEDFKKVIGRSPDKADAFILCLAGNYISAAYERPAFGLYLE